MFDIYHNVDIGEKNLRLHLIMIINIFFLQIFRLYEGQNEIGCGMLRSKEVMQLLSN